MGSNGFVASLTFAARREGMDCSSEDLAAAAAPFLVGDILSLRSLSLFLGDGASARTSAAAEVGSESAAGLVTDRPGLARVPSGGAREATTFDPVAIPAAREAAADRAGRGRMAGRPVADDRTLEAARAAASSASASMAPDEMCAGRVGAAMRSARLPLLRRALKHQDRAGVGRLTAAQLHSALMMVAAAAGGDAGQLGRVTLADCEATVRARGSAGEVEAAALSAIIAGTPAAAAARARGPQSAPARSVPPPQLPPAAAPRAAPSPLQAQRSAKRGVATGAVASSPVTGQQAAGVRAAAGFAAEPRSSPLQATAAQPGDWRRAHSSVADAVATQARGARYVHSACDREARGGVTAADLCAKMRRFGCELSDADAAALVERFDRTGDGRLTMSEFVAMLAASTA